MRILKSTKVAGALFMAFLMSNIPNVVMAEMALAPSHQMISTSAVLAELTRAEAETEVRGYLERSEVQSELLKQGLSPDEITTRLASLSEQEMRQLSSQVKEARAGGDILIAILVVVLIIYLIKRI